MSRGAVVAGLVVAALALGYVIYRYGRGAPTPDAKKLGPVQNVDGKNVAKEEDTEPTLTLADRLKGAASSGKGAVKPSLFSMWSKPKPVLPAKAKELGTSVNDSFKNQIVPLSTGIAAGGATVALQLRKLKGTAAKQPVYVKTGGGATKTLQVVKAAPKTGGQSIFKLFGQGATKTPATVPKPKLPTVIRQAAVVPKPVVIPQAAKVAMAGARAASKLLLPVGIGLAAADLADRIQKKGEKGLDVGDVAAAASGLGGLGLRKLLPEPLQKLAGTSLKSKAGKEAEKKAAARKKATTAASKAAKALSKTRRRKKK